MALKNTRVIKIRVLRNLEFHLKASRQVVFIVLMH